MCVKTYRLFSLRVFEGHENGVTQKNIPIENGLIIDVEDGDKKWLVDAIFEETDDFSPVEGQTLLIEVVITSKNNYPATMVVDVKKITTLSTKKSFLLEGHMAINRDEIIELILQGIVEEGISGTALLNEFKKRKGERGEAMQRIVDNIYKQVESQGKITGSTQ